MRIVPVPCLRDNYAYVLICEETNEAGVVDPSEGKPVIKMIEKLGVDLKIILNTHHHWDHVNGNKKLLASFPGLPVYGHHSDEGRIPGQNVFLREGDTIELGRLRGHFTHNPGHTTGAVSYYFGNAAFTGDTLFAAGCGRIFEGDPEQMYGSLNHQIGGHDDGFQIYFGHEYTEQNLRFAQTVEPGNSHVKEKLARVREIRKAGRFTTPSTLAEERQTNPFMRCDSPEIRQTVIADDPENDLSPVSVLKVIRRLKDQF